MDENSNFLVNWELKSKISHQGQDFKPGLKNLMQVYFLRIIPYRTVLHGKKTISPVGKGELNQPLAGLTCPK